MPGSMEGNMLTQGNTFSNKFQVFVGVDINSSKTPIARSTSSFTNFVTRFLNNQNQQSDIIHFKEIASNNNLNNKTIKKDKEKTFDPNC